MMYHKDIFVHHIFDKLNVEELVNLKKVDKFFVEVIKNEIIMDKMKDRINYIWEDSFGNDVDKFKKLLVDHNCIIVWNICKDIDYGIYIRIIGCDSLDDNGWWGVDDDIIMRTNFCNFMRDHNYGDLEICDFMDRSFSGYYDRVEHTQYTINVSWFVNISRMNKYLEEYHTLFYNNNYTICKDTQRDIITPKLKLL